MREGRWKNSKEPMIGNEVQLTSRERVLINEGARLC